jgi:large conductance mechanosensitive channel
MFNGLSGLRAAREIPGYGELSGFKKFLLRGNVVDLAVAVVIGTAFAAVVTSFTESFLTPLIALVSGGGRFGGVLRVDDQNFTYGAFISQVISFVITAAVVYFLVVVPVRRLLERRVEAAVDTAAAGPTELELLTEIRDLLRSQQAPGATTPPAPAP